MKKQVITLLTISMILTALTGCGGGSNTEAFLSDIEQLKAENAQLSERADALQKENNQLREQAMTLSSMKREVRLELIDTLAEIKINNRSGIFDKNEDGTPETLVVYLETLDNRQDYIKAIGKCRIELLDLNQPEGKTRVTSHSYHANFMNQNWGGNIFSSYFRLEHASGNIEQYLLQEKPKELTVRVTFTDYIGGKTLTAQKVIDLD